MLCKTCRNKTCLKTKKPCERIEKLLKDKGIYSADWIRPEMGSIKRRKEQKGRWREIPFSALKNLDIDKIDPNI